MALSRGTSSTDGHGQMRHRPSLQASCSGPLFLCCNPGSPVPRSPHKALFPAKHLLPHRGGWGWGLSLHSSSPVTIHQPACWLWGHKQWPSRLLIEGSRHSPRAEKGPAEVLHLQHTALWWGVGWEGASGGALVPGVQSTDVRREEGGGAGRAAGHHEGVARSHGPRGNKDKGKECAKHSNREGPRAHTQASWERPAGLGSVPWELPVQPLWGSEEAARKLVLQGSVELQVGLPSCSRGELPLPRESRESRSPGPSSVFRSPPSTVAGCTGLRRARLPRSSRKTEQEQRAGAGVVT